MPSRRLSGFVAEPQLARSRLASARLRRFVISALLLVMVASFGCRESAANEGASGEEEVGIWSASLGEVRFREEQALGREEAPPSAVRSDLDDGEWEAAPFWALPPIPGPFWARGWIEIPEPGPDPARPLGVLVSALAAHELYWDGARIGRSGRVGATAAEEEPGRITALHGIPSDLATPGRHLIALRLSSWHQGFRPARAFYTVLVADHAALARVPERAVRVPLVCLGALTVAAVFFLGLGLLDRQRRPERVLGLLSLATVGQLLAELWRLVEPYPYDWHIVRLRLIALGAFLVGALLIRFLVLRWRVRRGWWWSSAAAVPAVLGWWAAVGYDGKTVAILLAHLAVGLVLAVRVGWSRRRARRPRAERQIAGVGFAVAGITACLVLLLIRPGEFLDRSIYLGEGVMLVGLLLAHAREAREIRRRHEAARLTNLRLELELLKRYLNPHSLMNSLTALADLFEDRPSLAGPAIEVLATEIRTLGDMAARPEVAVSEELALCRAHLAVMGFRQERTFVLETDGVDASRRIPPAIFHTVLENALTHNRYPDGTTFHLRERAENGWVVYRLATPHSAEHRSSGAAPARRRPQSRATDRRGAGLRYIEARLRERYGDAWGLESRREGEEWWTIVRVPASPARATEGSEDVLADAERSMSRTQ